MKQKISLILLIVGFAFTLGVSCPPKKLPCDSATQGGAKMKVEYDYQEGYILDDYDNLYPTVYSAFEFVGTEITICRDTFFLPDDPYFFTPDGLLMRERLEQFFSAHKSSGLVYYLASPRGLDVNQGAQYKVWGATRPYPQPNVPPNPKWSFIFVGDIPEEYYGGRWTKHRHVTYVTIHELGHQRAGLTHPGSFPQYHQATYPCIMDTNVTSAMLNAMGFCWSSNPNSPDNCRYFLQQQNSK
jgi:hypothetical protein